MERNDEHRDDQLIDLGPVSTETKGPAGFESDGQGGRQGGFGLTED